MRCAHVAYLRRPHTIFFIIFYLIRISAIVIMYPSQGESVVGEYYETVERDAREQAARAIAAAEAMREADRLLGEIARMLEAAAEEVGS